MYIEKHRWLALVLTILIAIEIFYFSSIPSFPEPPVKGINLSIVYHIIVFFLLGFFLLASIKGNKKIKLKHVLLTLGIALSYSILDEVHQLFVLGRLSSISDVLYDLIGILLAILIYPKKERKKNKKEKVKLFSFIFLILAGFFQHILYFHFSCIFLLARN